MYDFSSVTEVTLDAGGHPDPAAGMCLMEMVAWFAGDRHTDSPACACDVLGAFGRSLNDNMPDAQRDALLKPLVPRLLGSASPAHRAPRAEILAWFAVREIAVPALLAA